MCNYDPYDLVGSVHHMDDEFEHHHDEEGDGEEDQEFSEEEWLLIDQWINSNQESNIHH